MSKPTRHAGHRKTRCPICQAKKRARARWHAIVHVSTVLAGVALVLILSFNALFGGSPWR